MQKTADSVVVFLIVTTCIILILVSFVITILYLYRKRQIEYFKGIEQLRSEYEKSVLKTQIEIQEQTFQAISRDIHDNINLSLTLAKLNLNTFDLEDKEKSTDKLNSSIEFISKAIVDLTDISRSMNSDIVCEQGLIKALELETEKLKKLNCFFVQFKLSGDPVFMDAQKELLIFRIIQESFNNILKHAKAKNIRLEMHYGDNRVDITVVDDGTGFFSEPELGESKTTSGLRNMRKRAELLEGRFNITSYPGAGTSIRILIPF